MKIEEGGSTALGPALLVSICIAAKKSGSKVVICTDGLANRGLGAQDNLIKKSETEKEQIEDFYTDLGSLASEKGVDVSIVSIKGEGCRLETLGRVADITGGKVNVVDPLNITKEFGSILAEEIIATNVSASLLVHKGLYIRTNDLEDTKQNRIVQHFGNITKSSEVTFEYGVNKENSKFTEGKKSLPFQVQINYTKVNGTKCIRVISDSKPLTNDRNVAEKSAKVSVLGTHVTQQSAKMAMDGEYTGARMKAWSNKLMMKRVATTSEKEKDSYNVWKQDIVKLDHKLASAKKKERRGGRNYSDDEAEYESNEVADMEVEEEKRDDRDNSVEREKKVEVKKDKKEEKEKEKAKKVLFKKEKAKENEKNRSDKSKARRDDRGGSDSIANTLFQMRKTNQNNYSMS